MRLDLVLNPFYRPAATLHQPRLSEKPGLSTATIKQHDTADFRITTLFPPTF